MADILKLKKKAADFEAKKQIDKALEVYVKIVDAYEAGDDDPPDIALYNRVGDMLQKAGRGADAVAVWEKAVDRYAEGGFYNPAIALCNKILRQSPGRMVVYYKLGKIHAEKGFKADARQNFLEYASRQQKAGNLDEAFRALKEFAELVPGQHDVRITLAEQLVKADRKDEAVEQLQLGYSQAKADDDHEAAERIAAKLKEVDPSVEPEAKRTGASGGGGGLVFLDIGDDIPPLRPSARVSTGEIKRVTKSVETLAPETPEPSAAPGDAAQVVQAADLGVEATDLGLAVPPPPRESAVGLEATNPAEEVPLLEVILDVEVSAEASPVADLQLMDVDAPAEPTSAPTDDLPLLEPEPVISLEPTALSVTLDTGPTAGLDLLDDEAASAGSGDLVVVHSGEVDAPVFDVPAPTADLPLMDVEAQEVVMVPAAPASSLEALSAAVAANPNDWTARRTFAEALLERGQRAEGMTELERTMAGFEASGDLDSAGSVADEIVRLEPTAIRSHQKRVEYAFRANNRAKLATAYLELADALLADGQTQKARTVYQRVLDITPDDLRAQAAIESIPAEEAPPPPPPRRGTVAAPRSTAMMPKPAPAAPPAEDDDGYVSLGDWLREDDEPKSTRIVVEEKEPTGDEQADFSEMLRKFKQGVAENVDEEDHEAHYDLGVAYKEMGLVDEAIAEFQKALRGTTERVRAFEALGNCFVEKGQLPVASTILQRALAEPNVHDESLIGVLYILGSIAEELQQFADAKRYYQRVFAVDIRFRDIGVRLNTVEQQLS